MNLFPESTNTTAASFVSSPRLHETSQCPPRKTIITSIYSTSEKGNFNCSGLGKVRSVLHCLMKTIRTTSYIRYPDITPLVISFQTTCHFCLQCWYWSNTKSASIQFCIHEQVKILFMVHNRDERPLRI
jgi:hypothetical protein